MYKCTLVIGKMKKLVKLMNQVKMIKLVIMEWGIKVSWGGGVGWSNPLCGLLPTRVEVDLGLG